MLRRRVERFVRSRFALGMIGALVFVGLVGAGATAGAVSTGDEGMAPGESLDAEALLEELEATQETAKTWRETGREAGPVTPDGVLETFDSEPTAEELFQWVRHRVEFEPYRGALRGPEEVLALRSANAVDQARLLAALYDRTGVSYRYVLGNLRGMHAVELLGTFAGRADETVAHGAEGAQLLSPEPAYSGEDFVDLVDDHVWLEVDRAGETSVPADPALASALGSTKGRVDVRSDHLPKRYRSRLEITLKALLQGGAEKDLITVEAGFDQLALEPMHFTFDSGSVKGTVVPRLKVVDRSETGERFVPSKVRRLTLEYSGRIGGHDRFYERELYVAGPEIEGFRHEGVAATAMIAPGWMSPAVAAHVATDDVVSTFDRLRERLERASDDEKELGSGAVESLLTATGTLAATGRPLHVDAAIGKLAQSTGVRPVRTEPRIVHAVASTSGAEVRLDVDSKGGALEAVPARGVDERAVEAFQALRGYVSDELEAGLRGKTMGRSAASTRKVLARAREKGVPVTTLHGRNLDGVDSLELSAWTTRELRRTVRNEGRVALVPKRPVEIDGRRQHAWWSVEPNGGAVSGRRGIPPVGFFEGSDARTGEGASMGRTIVRASKLLTVGLEGRAEYDDVACRGLRQARTVGRALCATRAPRALPALAACGESDAESEESNEIGVVGIRSSTCENRVRDARCGTRAAETLLSGGVRVGSVFDGDRTAVPGRGVPSAGSALRCGDTS